MSNEKVLSLWRMAGNNSEAEEAKTAAVKASQLMRAGTLRFGPGSFNADWSDACFTANIALQNVLVDQPLSKDARDQAMRVAMMVAPIETLVILGEGDADLPPPRMDGDGAPPGAGMPFDIGEILSGFTGGSVRNGGVAPAVAAGAMMGSFLGAFLNTRDGKGRRRAKNPVSTPNPFDLFEQWKTRISGVAGVAEEEPAPKKPRSRKAKAKPAKKRAASGKKGKRS